MKRVSVLTRTHFVIHGFAVAHALSAAAILWRGADPGTWLTILTIGLIVSLSRINDYPLDVTGALALIGCFAGFFLGTTGAEIFSKMLPEMAAQVVTTVLVTEVLGWLSYLIVKRKKE